MISSSSRFTFEGMFWESGVVHSFKMVDPVLFVFGFTSKTVRRFNAKLGRRDVFKLTVVNESVHQDSSDNSVRTVNFAHQKI